MSDRTKELLLRAADLKCLIIDEFDIIKLADYQDELAEVESEIDEQNNLDKASPIG